MHLEYKWKINQRNKILMLEGNRSSSLKYEFNLPNGIPVFQAEQEK